jgi:AdoMet-dependent heme synthase
MIVVWRVTERCNLACKFCGYDRDLTRSRREANPAQVRRFGEVLSAYQRATGDPVLISWLGGEPLLWPPLTELTRAFRRGHALQLSTTTNGTVLGSPEVRAHLLEEYTELTISVDGIGRVHNELRGWPGGFASLERHITALAEAKRDAGAGPVLRVNVLLMRDTLSELETLCFRLAGWGIEEVTFNQLGGVDRPEFYPAHRLLAEQAAHLATDIPRLRQVLANLGLRLRGGQGYLRRIQATARGERLPVVDCHPGERFLFVTETGLAAPCSFTPAAYGVALEELTSASDLVNLPLRFSELRRGRPCSACEDCHSTQVFEKFSP